MNEIDSSVARWRVWLETLYYQLNEVYYDQEMFEGSYQAIVDSGTTSAL